MPVRAALLSYFELDDLERLLAAWAVSGTPPGTRTHIGTYGVSGQTSAVIRRQEGARYSPIFKTAQTADWERRRWLTPDEERRVGPRFGGRVPVERLFRLSPAQRTAWGVEVGRRYRDSIRSVEREGFVVDSFQLDELGTQLAGPQGRLHREFVRGILQGLTFGRKVLADRERGGFIFATRAAMRLAALPIDLELRAFWRQLNRASFRLVGEEYPNFVGDPRRVARAESDGQRALAAGGPVRRALAEKYVVGMTPGYHLVGGLGGNTRGLPRAAVNRWRNTYVDERASQGVAGFGEYHFRFENSRTPVMQDAARAVARGMARS